MSSGPSETAFFFLNSTHDSTGNAGDEHYNASASGSYQFESVSTDALAFRLNWSFLSLSILIVATAAGNLMVCAAVFHERALQNMPNYFLTSLAVADFLVSVFIMPPGLVVLLFGYFPLHPSLCVVWASLDVLMCTASIWHMCTLSVDRYLTLRYPMKYGRNRSKATMVIKITSVWVISVIICSPLTVTGFVDYSNVYINNTCVPSMKHFVLYGSIMAFYVPLVIMLVTYTMTINILRRNHRLMKLLTLSSNRRKGRPLRRTVSETIAKTGQPCLNPGSASNTALPNAWCPTDTTSVSYLTASSSAYTGYKPSATPSVERRTPVSGLEPTAACSQDSIAEATLLSPFQERLAVSSMSITTNHSSMIAHPIPARWQFSRSQPSLSNLSAGNAARSRSKLPATWSCGGSMRGVHMTSAKTISELESVRNFDFLSAGTSMNSMPNNSSWSSASWNEQVMFERLSLIEAEMDECLMEMDDGNAGPSDTETEELGSRGAVPESPEAHTSRPKVLAENTGGSIAENNNSNAGCVKSSQGNFFATTIGISPPSTPTGSSLGTSLGQSTNNTLDLCTAQLPVDANLKRGSVSVPTDLCAENRYTSATRLNWIGYGSALRNVHRNPAKSFGIRKTSAGNSANSNTEHNSEKPSKRGFLQSSLSSENEAGFLSSFEIWASVGARCSKTQPQVERLADALSKSLGAQMQLVSVLSYYSPPKRRCYRTTRKPKASKMQSSASLSVRRLEENNQRLRPVAQSRLDATLLSGVDIAERVGKIPIILTPETSDSDSRSMTTGDCALRYMERSAATEKSSTPNIFSNFSNHMELTPSSPLDTTSSAPSPEIEEDLTAEDTTGHQTVSVTNGGFHRIPPVTISSPVSSPEERLSSNVYDHPMPYLRGLETTPEFAEKDGPKIPNRLTPGDGIGSTASFVLDGKGLQSSSDFLTVQACHYTSDSDPECSSATGRTSRHDSCSTLSDDTSSEVFIKATVKSDYLRSWRGRHLSKASLTGPTCCLRRTNRARSRNNSELELVLSKKVSRNERKASKVLGIILVAFVVFWSPFFLVNVLSAVCRTCDVWLNSTVATYVVWWGYASSLANPVIYTLFSKSFRTAFRRLLTCRMRRHYKNRKADWNKSLRRRTGNVYCENAV